MPVTKTGLQNATALKFRPEQLAKMEKLLLERFINLEERQMMIVKIMRYGTLIFEGIYGINCKPAPLGTDTIFCMQSISKPVIATLALILQEEGLVDVTDPVKQYLPGFDTGGKENIYLWHFLTHTSGFDSGEIYTYMQNELKAKHGVEPCDDWREYQQRIANAHGIELSDVIGGKVFRKYMMEMPLPRKPHKAMSYFNVGFEIIKDIIENESGENIDDYALTRLFAPLGMNDTHWVVPQEKWDRIIGRHENSWGSEWLNSEESFVSQSGAGGLKSTADDMLKYCEMVINEGTYNGARVMSRASVRAMVADHNETIEDEWEWGSWSLGWNYHGNKKDDSSILRSKGAVCHNGGGATKIYVDKEEGLTMSLCSVGMNGSKVNVIGRMLNMIYAALE